MHPPSVAWVGEACSRGASEQRVVVLEVGYDSEREDGTAGCADFIRQPAGFS